jgi:oligopeptide/dipeptide ABC transporter ATP-binding protein
MYGGRIVESGSVQEVFRRPRHRYTAGLLAASDLTATVPSEAGPSEAGPSEAGPSEAGPSETGGRGRLPTIPGSVPGAGRFPAGCVFRNRCEAATDACAEPPPWTPNAGGGYACWNPVAS